jgi:hypothetical protein
MSPSALPQDHCHTWTEYQTWRDDERWKIIDGVAYNMSPRAIHPASDGSG